VLLNLDGVRNISELPETKFGFGSARMSRRVIDEVIAILHGEEAEMGNNVTKNTFDVATLSAVLERLDVSRAVLREYVKGLPPRGFKSARLALHLLDQADEGLGLEKIRLWSLSMDHDSSSVTM